MEAEVKSSLGDLTAEGVHLRVGRDQLSLAQKPSYSDAADWQVRYQIVLPTGYRLQVLKLAHELPLSGHLGVTKTFHRVSKYYFWPRLKSAVSDFCRSCDVCQHAGKPNQRFLRHLCIPFLC